MLRWQKLAGQVVVVLGAIRIILDGLTHVDFLVERSRNPSWIGEVYHWLVMPGPLSNLVILLFGIGWLTFLHFRYRPVVQNQTIEGVKWYSFYGKSGDVQFERISNDIVKVKITVDPTRHTGTIPQVVTKADGLLPVWLTPAYAHPAFISNSIGLR